MVGPEAYSILFDDNQKVRLLTVGYACDFDAPNTNCNKFGAAVGTWPHLPVQCRIPLLHRSHPLRLLYLIGLTPLGLEQHYSSEMLADYAMNTKWNGRAPRRCTLI